MKVFEKAKWIWLAEGQSQDQYAEFTDSFEYSGDGKVNINLSCDTDYTLYVNGKFVESNQYGDFEHYKIYDTVDVTEYLAKGRNDLLALVHYSGISTSRYRPAPAGLIYEISCGEEILAYSREGVPSRLSPYYQSGKKLFISVQLGVSFGYDATAKPTEFAPAVCVEKNCELFARPIKKSVLMPRCEMKSVIRFSGKHWLIDLGGETVGVPTLDIVCDTEQNIQIAWGEHIEDGGVRKTIHVRNFYYEYRAKPGRNEFTNYMLRLGCRYLEVFAENDIELNYVGVLPQVYEVEERSCSVDGELERRIYDMCVNTLRLCMMEHYVDCPWREQALYAFDSRNQMLCGYYAFEGKNTDYARANLKLIGMDRRDDGLLSICAPCGEKLAIPSFSLYYIIAMKEYIDYTGDTSLARSLIPKMCGIFEEFFANAKDGLVRKFEGDNMWNFYDWTRYCEGSLGKGEEIIPDAAANCLFVIALDCFEKICEAVGEEFPYTDSADSLREHIREKFLDENGLLTMHAGRGEYTVLVNTLGIWAGIFNGAEKRSVCDKLISGELVDCTLSMKVLEYEALMQTDTDKYKDFILAEIRKNYKIMLDSGSDAAWETLDGAAAFDNAGSLCHGWSSVPVYIYHKLGIAKYID